MSDEPGGGPGAQELKRFEEGGKIEIPEGMPERFLKDGVPDFDSLNKSYLELDKKLKTKTEDLQAELKADLLKDRPEKSEDYKLPEVEGVELPADSPLIGWWREQAHATGLGQKGFEDGIKAYLDRANDVVDTDGEKKKLGDNADARIEAVTAWAQKTFDDSEYKAIQLVASSAAGVSALEKMMKGGKPLTDDGDDDDTKDEMTLDTLRTMQQDPRYWDNARRDPEYVKKIEAGYAKLYAKKS